MALLIGTVGGLFLAALAGSLRILQLRRRVRRDEHEHVQAGVPERPTR